MLGSNLVLLGHQVEGALQHKLLGTVNHRGNPAHLLPACVFLSRFFLLGDESYLGSRFRSCSVQSLSESVARSHDPRHLRTTFVPSDHGPHGLPTLRRCEIVLSNDSFSAQQITFDHI